MIALISIVTFTAVFMGIVFRHEKRAEQRFLEDERAKWRRIHDRLGRL